MYEIRFYKNAVGVQPVKNYIRELKAKAPTNKDARLHYKKITDYIRYLQRQGTRLGEKYTKHIDGDLWELRPLDDRIIFFCWNGRQFVLLHQFRKKTQKTPSREIETAKRRMKEFLEEAKKEEKSYE